MFERFARQTLTAAGKTEWIDEVTSLFGRPVDADTLEFWQDRFAEMFKERTAWQWEADINAQGGACTVCQDRGRVAGARARRGRKDGRRGGGRRTWRNEAAGRARCACEARRGQ